MSGIPQTTKTDSWALVTGSTSGIGRETAVGLAEDGYSLVSGRDGARAQETQALIESTGGSAVTILADLCDPPQCGLRTPRCTSCSRALL